VFAQPTLIDPGRRPSRPATLADRLAGRNDWPSDLVPANLPMSRRFRAERHRSPRRFGVAQYRASRCVWRRCGPEFRRELAPGAAELVLQTAQRAEQPPCAPPPSSPGFVDERVLVRRWRSSSTTPASRCGGATEALFWDTEHRWNWVRFAVRRALADPLYQATELCATAANC